MNKTALQGLIKSKIDHAIQDKFLPFPPPDKIEETDWITSETINKTSWMDKKAKNDFAKRTAEKYTAQNKHNPSLVFLDEKENEFDENMVDITILVRPHIPDPNIQPIV